MKIFIDLTPLEYNMSGIEKYAENLTKALIAQDKKNTYYICIANKLPTGLCSIKKRDNVIIKKLHGSNRIITTQVLLPLYLSRIACDYYLFFSYPVPLLFMKKKIVFTIHDLTPWLFPKTMTTKGRLFFKFLTEVGLRKTNSLLTVSNSSKNDIQKYFKFNKKIHVIYNGLGDIFNNSTCERELLIHKYNLPNKFLCCVATIEPRKNLMLLLKAYKELLDEEEIDVSLVLVGRLGWKEEKLIKWIRHNDLTEKIIFTGYVDDEDLPSIYRYASVFVLPSLYEGFGVPVIEALYCKTLAVVSDIKAHQEIAGEDAIYFRSNDLSSLKEKIMFAYHMPVEKRKSWIEKGHKKALGYSWNKEATKLLNLISEGEL